MQLPIYQHPSLTVLIDDSDSFLASLTFQLDPTIASKAFHDTSAALGWLRQQHADTPQHWPLSASFDTNARSLEQCSVALDVDQIYRISFRPQRFMQPSVLVVDYSMPQMNGVDFCEALRTLPCKKILFTGTADEKIAVDAFNRGLIDRYIKKSDDDALDKLETEIAALKLEYFAAQSDTLRELLALHNFSFVSDPAMAALVDDVSRTHGIVEHYLYPNPAGILLYDADGNAMLMVVETNDSMEAHHEVARDSGAPRSLLTAIDERCIIPFFRNGDGMYGATVGPQWYRYCEAAQVCRGKQVYFWALFKLAPGELPERPASFSQFLENHHHARKAA